jgi:murein DD-endopeptidase MepM/ murein hydrolase activator NlpD
MSADLTAVAQIQFDRVSGSREQSPSLKKLTQEFEAIFLHQLLSVMRETVGSDGIFEESAGQDIYTSMMDQAVARALALQGGIGLAAPLLRHLEGAQAEAAEAGAMPEGVGGAAAVPRSPDPSPDPAPIQLAAAGRRLTAMVEGFEYSSGPGWRRDPFTTEWRYHRGLDLAAPEGTEVLSVAGGRVVFSGEQGSYGRTVIVEDSRGNRVRYAHLKDIHVQEGEEVQRGQKLGEVGSTGRSTGPHLHLEVEGR